MRWTEGVRHACRGEVVAIDGKALRRAKDAGEQAKVIVGAWDSEAGISLGQLKVDGKSNEITVVPKLLELLAIKGNHEKLHERVVNAQADPSAGNSRAIFLQRGTVAVVIDESGKQRDFRQLLRPKGEPAFELGVQFGFVFQAEWRMEQRTRRRNDEPVAPESSRRLLQ